MGLTIKHHCKGYLWMQNMYHKEESQAGKAILEWCQASFLDFDWDTTMGRYESLFILKDQFLFLFFSIEMIGY